MVQDNFPKTKKAIQETQTGVVSLIDDVSTITNTFEELKNKYEYDINRIDNEIIRINGNVINLGKAVEEYSNNLSDYMMQTFGNVFMLFAEMQESIITASLNSSITSAYLEAPWYKKITKKQRKKLFEKIKKEKEQDFALLFENNRVQKERILKNNRERLNIDKTKHIVKFEKRDEDVKDE